MLRTCDVCVAYEAYALRIYDVCTSLRSILICGVSVLYQLFLSHLFIAGCDIGVQISVRPSTFTSKFGKLRV